MDIDTLVARLEASPPADWMRDVLLATPVVNALHVMAVALVFGTILIVDLRLLGFPDRSRPFRKVAHELLPWTWVGFGVAVVTGALMFVANAGTYVGNTAFWAKMIALGCAGLNMAAFELITARSAARWDTADPPPAPARIAGGLSILFWLTVIFFGRWIGFTKGYDFEIPDGVELDFDFSALVDAAATVWI